MQISGKVSSFLIAASIRLHEVKFQLTAYYLGDEDFLSFLMETNYHSQL
jgi:hypothetical protein